MRALRQAQDTLRPAYYIVNVFTLSEPQRVEVWARMDSNHRSSRYKLDALAAKLLAPTPIRECEAIAFRIV